MPRRTIVEAFPNAFLGVLTPEVELLATPKFKHGRRFDWLCDQMVTTGRSESLLSRNLICQRRQSLGKPKEGWPWLSQWRWKGTVATNAKPYHATGPFPLGATGLVFHFLLGIRGRRWMIAMVSGRAPSQKSESCEEYWCHDF
jgi:hypothetical protein